LAILTCQSFIFAATKEKPLSGKPLKITFLGTGTSQGVPVIGCNCDVCTSPDPKDQRLRVSLLIESAETTVVIDAGPDFRQQMLRAGVQKLDAVLITHEHNDHIIGLDDVRPFNFRQKRPMPIYAMGRVLKEIKKRFEYIFDKDPYPGAPKLELVEIEDQQELTIGDLRFKCLELLHGNLPILGFKTGEFAYLTDVKTIPESSKSELTGLKHLVINALHHKPHKTHLNLLEALELIQDLNPGKAYLTHISHHMGKFEEVNPTLPSNVTLAFDGLSLSL